MPNNVEINFDLSGLEQLKENLGQKINAKVGVLGDSASREGGEENNATIGATHEFGSFTKNIPQRSFLKMPIAENSDKLTQSINFEEELTRKEGVKNIFEKMAVNAVAIVQTAFETGGYGKWQPLSNQTIKKKKSASILIDTAQLRKSITYRVDNE